MSKAKEVFRKTKVLFLCAFVAAQIFIPQAVVEAATCKHNYQSILISHEDRGHYYHTFEDRYQGTKGCNITMYLNTYVNKCTRGNTKKSLNNMPRDFSIFNDYIYSFTFLNLFNKQSTHNSSSVSYSNNSSTSS